MSMDAGGLAQMTYSNFPSNGALGVPSSGFASRGKGSHISRLAMPPTQTSGSGDNGQATPAPRTSRSHLLANLRTAPKSPGFPPSAPPSQLQHHRGLDGSKYAEQENSLPAVMIGPKSAIGSFPSQTIKPRPLNQPTTSRQMYSVPEQVLAPPSIQVGQEQGEEQMDPSLYAELVATNLYLAQQQQRLQQQLINVTAAAQQFNGLSLSDSMAFQQQQQQQQSRLPQHFAAQNAAQAAGLYNQQPQTSMQPLISPVPGAQAGLYSVYNPLTGQQGYFLDQNAQQPQYAPSPPATSPEMASPTQQSYFPGARYSPPAASSSLPPPLSRNTSSPKPVTSPTQSNLTLPPPSANAFRRGHKNAPSAVSTVGGGSATPTNNGPKTPAPKSAAFPTTPVTGTFGPGQARAGEHPVRQPRGPPPLEELVAHPTTKHEGSKNFATRQRRRAVHSLVRAGIERRGAHRNGSSDSAGSMTPVSETEITFSVSSDNDSDSLGSGSLSGKPSLGSLRARVNGAIGSERKEMKERSRERDSLGSQVTANSVSSDDGTVGGKLVEVKAEGEMRKTPLLVLTSAEKRKSSLF